MIPIAHAGHWLVGLLQFLPVLAFLGWLFHVHRRDRKLEAAEKAAEE